MSSNLEDEDFKSTSSMRAIAVKNSNRKRRLEEEVGEESQHVKKLMSAEEEVKSVAVASTSKSEVKKEQDLANVEDRISISELIGDGVTSNDLERLKEHGLCTVEAVAQASSRTLTKISGISVAKAGKLVKRAKELTPISYTTAATLFEKRADILYITTGSKGLDQLLRGGFETGSMTEIFGESRSGKTQICCTLAITCQLPVDSGGAEGKCLYIDSEGSFRPERLIGIAQRYNLDVNQALENVAFSRAFNCEHLMEMITVAAAMLAESRYALVIVDSVMALFRTEYTGRGELQERQTQLGQFLHALRRLCDEYGVAVVYTNQVVADVSSMSFLGMGTVKPAGGNIMSHAATTRLSLRKGRGDTRICKVYTSPTIPESEAPFAITTAGVCDPTDE